MWLPIVVGENLKYFYPPTRNGINPFPADPELTHHQAVVTAKHTLINFIFTNYN